MKSRRARAMSLWLNGLRRKAVAPPRSQMRTCSPRGDEPIAVAAAEATALLCNLPRACTRAKLLRGLSEIFEMQKGFCIPYKTRCQVGFSFVQFRNREQRDQFVDPIDGQKLRACLPGFSQDRRSRPRDVDEDMTDWMNRILNNYWRHIPQHPSTKDVSIPAALSP